MPNGENTILFNNYVRSDGFAIDFVFNRRRKDSIVVLHDLTLQDFTYNEVESTFRPAFVDPGRKSVFTAAVGLGDAQQIRGCSTKEYYTMTGSTNYQKKMERLKNVGGITSIESEMPSAKTNQSEVYDKYVEYMLPHRQVLFNFYGFQRAKDRFYLYQQRQKAAQIMVNMIINGGKKYDRKQRKKKKRRRKEKK
ncbi:uncharacterized protein BX663DRAFT_478072 [Cokeromyces recurvatus]|uniref:uncharacterized protein n=1 Tax=Cokeromyces recurvatus TaxID=90255 RepID=UPI00221E7A05|nr:uncharacterized protein BX663DRAFT_478072 [Cokeromyces recurvatus]KAI7899771.1 hypothetical protein BX663DRAFT_478072 [Cokeromyces recurvatus]